MEKRTRRKYSPEFKREAVQLAANPGQSIAGVARNLGIRENLLRRWKKEEEIARIANVSKAETRRAIECAEQGSGFLSLYRYGGQPIACCRGEPAYTFVVRS